jgi:phytoene dehydrogenase-like protein
MVDAVVVGAGPNGLAAAVTLARAGLSVEVVERNDTIGGGARTSELTLPGFLHDVCSAVHPMALQSEFFRRFRMEDRIELRLPEVQYGHPLDGGRAGIAYQDLDRTAAELGVDGPAFKQLMAPLARNADQVADFATDALLHVPRHPLTVLRFGLRALEQGSAAWNVRFRGDTAPAMVSGVAAHSIQHLPSLATAAAALSLGSYAHARGWPVPIGGSQAIVDALAADLVAHGGTITTGQEVRSLADLTPAKAVLFDTSVPGMLRIAGTQIPTPKRGARAPQGKHVFWAYAHVPAGSTIDPTEMVTQQIERFAPGFRDTVLASSARTAVQMAEYNPNYVGGDIAAGAASFWQLVKRPVLSSDPWRMGGGMYLCSEASAPGPGVHGMAGWHAAKSALRHTFGLPEDVDLTPED